MEYPYLASKRRQELRVMAHLMADSDYLDEDVRAWMVERLASTAMLLDDNEVEVFLNQKMAV